MLGALGGGSGRSVDDPVAGGMVRHFGLIAAGALLPVAGRAELPVVAVAVGMLTLGGGEGIADADLLRAAADDLALQPLMKKSVSPTPRRPSSWKL